MARSCKHNNDCPQGKTCLIVAGANSGYCQEKGSTTVGSDKPIAGGGAGIQCASDAQCPQGLTCQNGVCNQRTVITSGGGQAGGSNDGGGTPTPAETCEVICEPPDPYQMNAGNQPMGTEGYVSSYADPWLQQGMGAGSIAPNSGFDFNTYVQQQQQYEQDWANYQQAMRSGTTPAATPAANTTPAAGATTTFQDALAQQQQNQTNYGY